MFGSRVRTAVLIGAIGAAASGCATTHARSAPDTPPLDMPPPPPRAIETADTEPPPPIALPDEPARHTTANTRRAPAPSPKPEANKPEPPKADAPPATLEAPKPAEEPPKPPPTMLQTTPAGRESEEEQLIRAQLSRATADLNRIDYRALNADARTQYNTAKRFVTQAEEALRAKNLVFARSVADKAAALAAQLAGK